MSDNFGMMDNAYFTSKSEILKWLNTTLQLNVTKVEQASTGAIYCQLLDTLYPGKVKMSKVNWKAKNELEFLQNLKILQQSFNDLGINKAIDIAKLAKGRYQDNFEILQWFKGYFDNKNPDMTRYDARKRRNYAELTYGNNTNTTKEHHNNGRPKQRNKSKEKMTKEKLTTFIDKVNIDKVEKIKEEPLHMEGEETINQSITPLSQSVNLNENIQENINSLNQKIEEEMTFIVEENNRNKREINTLKMLLAEVGKEKEFYFSKLRDFEFLLNKDTICDKNQLIELMKKILYSEKETEVIIDEYGNPTVK